MHCPFLLIFIIKTDRGVVELRMKIRDGLHYNPYFPGGAIAMPKMLIDGAIEYEDGTPATESQVPAPFSL